MRYICVDVGSTWTKAAAIDDRDGLVAAAAHVTTIATDVMDGIDACRAALADQGFDVGQAETIACSSAGGGLRIAVVGNESLVTAEAGRRVSLSSGGHVVAVKSGGVADDEVAELLASRPDLIVLTGGTNGGNPATLLSSARALSRRGSSVPVVVAGDDEAAAEAASLLADVPHLVAPNVVPEIGVFQPDAARDCVREAFLQHVIGGKGLSRRPEFARIVVGPTPDIVLRGTEQVAAAGTELVVVDIGGATTDVHSVVAVEAPEPRDDERGPVLGRDAVAQVPATRTVEGDLGMRWSAPTTVTAGRDSRLLAADPDLDAWVAGLTPDRLPGNAAEVAWDAELATTAAATALRRHAGVSEVMFVNGQRIVLQTGTDVRTATLLVGSGGVLRANPARGAELLERILATADEPGRMLPRRARVAVDADYLLCPIGLLAHRAPDAARVVVAQFLDRVRG